MDMNRRAMMRATAGAFALAITMDIAPAEARKRLRKKRKRPLHHKHRRPQEPCEVHKYVHKNGAHKGHHHYDTEHHRIHPHHRADSMRALHTLDTPGNRRDMALTIWGEARSYGTQGMRCVAHVIMNRAEAEKRMFGSGIHGVCHKRKQFSCWNMNDPNRTRMDKLPEMSPTNPDWLAFVEANRVAGMVLSGAWKDITAGATFYHTEDIVPYWRRDMQVVGVQFGHIFYKPLPRRRKFRHKQKVTVKRRH